MPKADMMLSGRSDDSEILNLKHEKNNPHYLF